MKTFLLFLVCFNLLLVELFGQTSVTTRTDYDKIFYVETYGARAGDSVDDLTGIQNAINAAYTAGGGIVKLSPGTYRVTPSAGIGILLKTGVRLSGLGSTITFIATGTAADFTGISPFGHNTTSTQFGAHELDIEDVTLGVDDATDVNTHSLIGVNHCPKGRIANVKFTGCYYHGLEINKSRSIRVVGCSWSGTYRSSQVQIDVGNSGVISTSGNAGTQRLNDNIVFDGNWFGPRDDLTLSHIGSGATGIEICHTNTSLILRGLTIVNNTFYGTCETSATGSTFRSIIGGSKDAYAEISNVVIQRNHFISTAGTGTVLGFYLDHSSGIVRNVDFSNNTFEGGFRSMCLVLNENCSESAEAAPATSASIRYDLFSGVRIVGNNGTLWLNANGAAGTRLMRLFCVGGCNDAVVSGNTVTIQNTVDANWTSTSATATSPSHFIAANHVRNLEISYNRFNLDLTTVTGFAFRGIATASSGFEATSTPYYQVIVGNSMNGTTTPAAAKFNIAYSYTSSYARASWAVAPLGRGRWEGNTSTYAYVASVIPATASIHYPYYVGSGNGWYTGGCPDWRPGYERIGEKVKSASTPGAGWRLLDGTNTADPATGGSMENTAWQVQCATGTRTLTTVANTYIRLEGSELNPSGVRSDPP